LLEKFGYYKTMGWAIDTWTISSGLADEDQFLSDMNHTVNTYDRMMQGLLPKGDYDLYVQVYYFTDRIQHVLWRYMDPKHPMYVASKAPKYQAAIKAAYERMDQIVGQAMREMPKDSVLMVLSDHGFTSFRYGVNYNRWLIDHGYMTLKADTGVLSLQDLFDDNRLLFKNVDWSKTKAYALGLGNIYINVKGREAHGIVEPGKQYREVCEAIQKELPQMVDPATGEHPVYKVYTRDELYSDYNPDLVPDLRVTNIPGYRVSWQTSLGGAPDQLITPNKKAWSGDHCSMDPSFVPGSFFLSVPINEHPRMIDVAPTILKLLKVKVPESMEGHPMVGGGETR
ncbi:MAG: alkaline phosphatase family protein, partial [Acidobacteriota bacterium]